VRSLGAQKIDELGQPIRGMIVERLALPPTVQDQLPTVFGEDFGNFRYREHQVHGACHDGAPRHAVILGLARILHDDEPALLLDRL
jgi:hypothetical protein